MLLRLLAARPVSQISARRIGGKHEDYIWRKVLDPDEWKGPKTKPEPWAQPGWWVEDHYPRKLPETEEERRKSARKYGIREGDYKPLPLDACMGEYPDLGIISYELRDPYENWSDTMYRRNFNEPMSPDFMYYLPYRLSYTGTEKYSHGKNFLILLLMTIGMITAFYVSLRYGPSATAPMLPKQFPYDYDRILPFGDPRIYPIEHYTFEPAEE
uniref:NADH dehydrogenase [ubiquinone] 1 beta subcomplex subunit 8, mitochondrial n=1 Tax=Romanomermis culicivorax TaxID=13658 RepID=A0A915KVH6_ROMCU